MRRRAREGIFGQIRTRELRNAARFVSPRHNFSRPLSTVWQYFAAKRRNSAQRAANHIGRDYLASATLRNTVKTCAKIHF